MQVDVILHILYILIAHVVPLHLGIDDVVLTGVNVITHGSMGRATSVYTLLDVGQPFQVSHLCDKQ